MADEETRMMGRRRMVVYVLVLLALLVIASFATVSNRAQRAHVEQWRADHAKATRDWQQQLRRNIAAYRAVNDLFADRKPRLGWPSRADAERLLNNGGAFEPDSAPVVRDVTTGGDVAVILDGDRWTEVELVMPVRPRFGAPSIPWQHALMDMIRRGTCMLGDVIVGLLLITLWVCWRRLDRRRRICVSADVLAAALFVTALSMLGPQHHRVWNVFWQDDSGGWGVIFGAVASLTLLAAALTRKPRDLTRCRKCNYDLTGNISGICPECGTAVASHSARHSQSATPIV